jgi:hypothetical protein
MKYGLFSAFIFLALAGSASAQGYFGGVGGDGGMGRWHGVMPQPPVTLKAQSNCGRQLSPRGI